ncbi:TadE/TadG family type IV pilus assembly protein [Paraherbaspirillum soli]|uniref:TadE/TadG family type IV pilus assembly protein n=1 Tax=Paraherbaspirillum soli TaxID=631222 RepID=A0ABW0MCD9_9BURK
MLAKIRAGKRRQERGASVVEFALIAPLFFLLLFAVFDSGIMFWVNLTMQYAVREGARYAVTGQSNLDPNQLAQQRYLAVIQEIKNNSLGLYDTLNPVITITNYGSDGSSKTTQTYDPKNPSSTIFGGPGDIVVLQLDNCTWSNLTVLAPFFPNRKYQFNVAATMRNEAFP